MVGQVIKVPKEVSESGYIRIVADQRHCVPNSLNPGSKWSLLAVCYDIEEMKTYGDYFAVTQKEIDKWLAQKLTIIVNGKVAYDN